MNWNVEDYLIFETVTGSQMYGTATPLSDLDTRGVCIPPREVLLDPFHGFEQADSFPGKDRAIYSLAKFFKLTADANPNVIELLFAPRDKWITASCDWSVILDHKSLFVSKKARFTFSGYAISQLNAIKTHRRYFINPPKDKPHRKDFGLTDSPIVSGDNLSAAANLPGDLFREEVRDEVRRELEYRKAKQDWDNFVSWRDNRNPARKELEDKFGYDTKHASHLVRLMTEGKELLLTGNITFPLPNAEEILAIRRGKYTYEETLEMAEKMDAEFAVWYDQSTLQYSPDWSGIKKLYFDLVGA